MGRVGPAVLILIGIICAPARGTATSASEAAAGGARITSDAAAKLDVWPLPAEITEVGTSRSPISPQFKISVDGQKSTPLMAAVEQYTALLQAAALSAATRAGGSVVHYRKGLNSATLDAKSSGARGHSTPHELGRDAGYITDVVISVPDDAPEVFDIDVCENSTLTIAENSQVVNISACSAFGAMRALETLAQLAIPVGELGSGGNLSLPVPLEVFDYPRFAYRGLMIDTARHYMNITFLRHIVESMQVNKLNVLHIHFSDDQSFPVQSLVHPRLAEDGSFGSSYVYTQDAIKSLVSFAQNHGVVIIPEFDMPAHSSSWGAGYPELMVNCSAPFTHGNTLNPILDDTYDFVNSLVAEMSSLFPGRFFHLGGDEVPASCWSSNPSISAWMKEHNMTDFGELEAYFFNRVIPAAAKAGKNALTWEEVFENGVNLPSSSLVEAWKSGSVLQSILTAGNRAFTSYLWYLNHSCDLNGDGPWTNFYNNDPVVHVPNATDSEKRLLIGGETAMWNVCVDAVNFDGVVWPRAAGAAEQLWSPSAMTRSAAKARGRMSTHRCRLVGRGVAAAPLDAEFLSRGTPCQ